jgi:hypothetical protein
MVDYVKEVINAWDKAPQLENDGFTTVKSKRGMKGKKCAAPEDLFKVDEDATKLNTEMSTAFHNIVAKALYLVKRARPDASVSIAFLTTRVRSPDVDDWRKLGHLIGYLRSTVDLPLKLGGDNSGVLRWYVDASFAVHSNMRGHTGGGLTMGKGFPIVSSTKQKLNTRSSTESELVGVDDMMPSILWTRYFLKAQGYHVNDNIIFQDNKSSMLLERNGKASSSRRTKHINVRYFFITDRIAKGEVRVEWCPTKQMIADFMTKPLQGSAFRNFRNLIMGLLSMKEAANVLTNDVVSRKNNKGLADRKVRHRSVLDYMGECNLKGRRTEKNDRSLDRSSNRSKTEKERSIERLGNDRSNDRSKNRSKDRSKERNERSNDRSKGGNDKNGIRSYDRSKYRSNDRSKGGNDKNGIRSKGGNELKE